MGLAITKQSWQEADAEADEIFADELEQIVLAIQGVTERFKNRPEIRDSSNTTIDLFRTEITNLRRAADQLRSSVGALVPLLEAPTKP